LFLDNSLAQEKNTEIELLTVKIVEKNKDKVLKVNCALLPCLALTPYDLLVTLTDEYYIRTSN